MRYPLVISTGSIRRGGTRERHFAGTNCKPRKLLENAHCEVSSKRSEGAVLGGASLDGNMVFLVTQDDSRVVLFYDPLIFENLVYIALQP